MKLSKIYSNNEIFEKIKFNEGFNVIFAKIKQPKDTKKDSHNLGKTLLISLIEFMLLKRFEPSLFLKKHQKLFLEFEFYLELKLNSGKYLTIKRTVKDNTKIYFKLHDNSDEDFRKLKKRGWDYSELPLKKAVKLLNKILDLKAIYPWSYRLGISYFLRDQNDYRDVFQIEKFIRSSHVYWKPYLAKMLGFNEKIIMDKYGLDETIKQRDEYRIEFEKTISIKTKEYDKLKGVIEIKKREVKEISDEIDKFNFYEEELKLNKSLLEEVESNVSFFNNERYNIDFEIEEINTSLSNKVEFNLEDIKKIFGETKIHFSENLSKSYDDLLRFNKELYTEREEYLKQRLKELKKEKIKVEEKLKLLNKKRGDILEFLRGEETFKKFKNLQRTLIENNSQIVKLESELETLNSVEIIQKEIENLNRKREKIIKKIIETIKNGNKLYYEIRKNFSQIIRYVLNAFANLYIEINNEGNLEFKSDIFKDEKSLDMTSEGEGTSYKKILCSAFDLAVLREYYNKEFFRFVYHDGIIEGLDNRKKLSLLNLIRDYCNKYGIQYILTAIETDLPRDSEDKKIYFDEKEIIRKLHDEGDDGRLFKMSKF